MRVTVHIPDSLGPKVKQAAETEGLSLSGLTAKALTIYLKQKTKRESGMKLLDLISSEAVSSHAWEELKRGRGDDRS